MALVAPAAGCASDGDARATSTAPARPARPGGAAAEPPARDRSTEATSEALFLHVFPLLRNPALPPEQALIHVRGWDGKEFGELGRRKGSAKARQGVVTVTLGSYMQSRDAVEPRYLECSFVIDCDEPIFQELNQQIARDVSPKPTIEQLVRFVDGYIANKNNRRGFDLASTVAARRAGDCTEHATLLAALTRLYEIPSRVVLGMVLVQVQGNDIHAFGHAWTEVHDGSRWKVADAALEMQVPDREPLRVHYLPIRVLDDEGPGHTAAMLHGANVWQVEKVQLSSALRELPGH